MRSSPPVHRWLRTEICSCAYKVEPYSVSASSDDERRRRKKIRRTNSNLPDDVITEILLRIPAKNLHQFKCVCKSWYNLIRSRRFIASHYTIHKMNQVSICCDSHSRLKRISTITFLFSDVPVYLYALCFDHPKIVGCSYGLVCLSLFEWDTKFLLWNPATGDCKLIFFTGRFFSTSAWIYSGFCFDSVSNTHKVVRISILPLNPPFRDENSRVYVDSFTLNTNSWETKEPTAIPCEIPESNKNISEVACVGRFMYWVLNFSDDDKRLLCFNMVDEVFQEIEFPCFEHSQPSTVLADYKGSLAMFVWKADIFDVWLLNDDCGGSRYSWSKKLTMIPSLPDVQAPIGFFLKGKVESVVLSTDSGYFLWNADSGEATMVLCEDGFIPQLFHYRESLASVW